MPNRLLVSVFSVVLSFLILVQPLMAADAIDDSVLDPTTPPEVDFYQFATGGWQAANADTPGFDSAYELVQQQVQSVMDTASADPSLVEGSDTWKAVQFYQQGLNTEQRDALGVEPIRPLIEQIQAIDSAEAAYAFQSVGPLYGVPGFTPMVVMGDFSDSSMTGVLVLSPRIGLQAPEYYLTPDGAPVLDVYTGMLTSFLIQAGYTEAEATDIAAKTIAFETEIAEAMLSSEAQGDLVGNYTPMTIAELQDAYPFMDWRLWADNLGMTNATSIGVMDAGFLEKVDGIFQAAPVEALHGYYLEQLFWGSAEYLSTDIAQIKADFYTLFSPPDQRTLEARTSMQVSELMPWAVGQLYVADYFPESAKQEALEMTEYQIQALRNRIENNPWMSDEARARALVKVDSIRVKIGYPDEGQWPTHDAMQPGDNYGESFLSALSANKATEFATVGTPVNIDAWINPPQNLNGSYDPTTNTIAVSAAMLMPPYFQYGGDAALNFGGSGTIIAHELTHGFDGNGSQFDENGTLAPWWTDADYAAYQERTDQVIALYDGIEVAPGARVNGSLTLNENVSDLGGLQISYDAFQLYLADHADEGATPEATPVVAATPLPQATPVRGMSLADATPNQRFFIGYANSFQSNATDDMLTAQVQNDYHSPSEVRVTVPIQQVDGFYEAFDIQPGDPMWVAPEDRVVIW